MIKVAVLMNGREPGSIVASTLQNKKKIDLKFFTTYPKFFIRKFHIKENNIKSFYIVEVFKRIILNLLIWCKFKDLIKIEIIFDLLIDYLYCFFLNKKTNVIIIGFGNSFSKTISKAKKYKIKIIYMTNTASFSKLKKLNSEYRKFKLKNILPLEFYIHKKIKENIKSSDLVIFLSSEQKKTFLFDKILPKKSIILPYPINKKLIKFKNYKKNKFIILFVGNDFIRKGAYYLIKAFNSLRLKNAELWMVGNNLNKYATLLKLPQQNIRYFGSLNYFKLNEIYNRSSIFCMPSFAEGFSLSISQAMLCGLPIITSKFGKDIIINNINGYVIEPKNIKKIKNKIKFLYKNKNRLKKMSNYSIIIAKKKV